MLGNKISKKLIEVENFTAKLLNLKSKSGSSIDWELGRRIATSRYEWSMNFNHLRLNFKKNNQSK